MDATFGCRQTAFEAHLLASWTEAKAMQAHRYVVEARRWCLGSMHLCFATVGLPTLKGLAG